MSRQSRYENEAAQIDVSENRLSATLKILDFSLPPRMLLEKIKSLLSEAGIRFGIQVDEVKRLITEKKSDHLVTIARGTAPIPPTPPAMEELIDFSPTARRADVSNKRVDHKMVIRPNVVKAGTPLIRIIHGEPGKPGKDICGEIIPAPATRNLLPITLGKNVKISDEDPNLVIAEEAGAVHITRGNKLEVQGTFVVEGDVNYESGNIEFPGSVLIKGDVKSGFRVVARQNILVQGNVDNAHLEAGQDIQIKHGFTGGMKGLVKAGRNVILGFAHYQKIEAGQDVTFSIELVGCDTTAARSISSRGGRIVGGISRAIAAVEARSIGSEEQILTRIEVGQVHGLNEELEELSVLKQKTLEQSEAAKKTIYELVSKKMGGGLSVEDEQRLLEAQKVKQNGEAESKKYDVKIAELKKQIAKLKKSFVRINGIIYPNVEIKLGAKFWRNSKEQRFVKLIEVDKQISVTRA